MFFKIWVWNFEYTWLHSIEAYVQREKLQLGRMWLTGLLFQLFSNRMIHPHPLPCNSAVRLQCRKTVPLDPLALRSVSALLWPDISWYNANRDVKSICVIVPPFLCLIYCHGKNMLGQLSGPRRKVTDHAAAPTWARLTKDPLTPILFSEWAQLRPAEAFSEA